MSTLESSPEFFTTPNQSPPREIEVTESSQAIVPYQALGDIMELARTLQSLPEVIHLPWIDTRFRGRTFARRRKKTCNPNPPRVSPVCSGEPVSPVEANRDPPTASSPPLSPQNPPSPVQAVSPSTSSDTPLVLSQTAGRRRSSRLNKAPQQQTTMSDTIVRQPNKKEKVAAKRSGKRPRPDDDGLRSAEAKLRTKRRHEASTMLQPFHPDFFFEESKIRFEELYETKDCLIEKPFYNDAPTVFAILQANNLENIISVKGKFNKTLVSEFYANCVDCVSNEDSQFRNKVYVRGVWVPFSPDSINVVLGSPNASSGYSPELERTHIASSDVAKTLTHNKVKEWIGNLRTSSLTVTFHLLAKLCKSQWIPSTHLSTINIREAMLMFVLASDTEHVNIGNVIYENILLRAENNKQKNMAHPVLITRLLEEHSVPSRPSDLVITVPSPLTSNIRAQSGNRVNDIHADDVQATQGTKRQGSWKRRIKTKLFEALNDCQNMRVRITSVIEEIDEQGMHL